MKGFDWLVVGEKLLSLIMKLVEMFRRKPSELDSPKEEWEAVQSDEVRDAYNDKARGKWGDDEGS